MASLHPLSWNFRQVPSLFEFSIVECSHPTTEVYKMKPDLLAEGLRRVAIEIDSSKNPSRVKVSRSLQSILMHLGNTWEGTDVDKVKKKIDEYVELLKKTRETSRISLLSRDWEEIRHLVQSPEMIEHSDWSDWSPEALHMLERNLDHMIQNMDLYLEE